MKTTKKAKQLALNGSSATKYIYVKNLEGKMVLVKRTDPKLGNKPRKKEKPAPPKYASETLPAWVPHKAFESEEEES